MVKCPKCGKDIDCLTYTAKETSYGDFRVLKEGWGEYEETENEFDVSAWFCPECVEQLFTEEADAIQFLKGEPDE